MNTLEKQILEIISIPQVSGLATISEDGKPWVRNVVTRGNEDMILQIATSKHMRKVKHITDSPEVHLSCGSNSLTEMAPYLQITGIASIDESEEVKGAFWNPGLEQYFNGPTDPDYVVIKVKMTQVEYYDPKDLAHPKIWNRAS